MLVFGFGGEGKADYTFGLEIVRRTLQDLLPMVEVLPVPIHLYGGNQQEKLIHLARESSGYDIAIIHLDADGRTFDRAYKERFLPGYEVIQSQSDEVNKMLIPVIPIRVTEAWMLTDFDAFREVTNTKKTAGELGFPGHPHQVEAMDAKAIFESAVRNARAGRRRQLKLDTIYLPLAEVIRLSQLRIVPAFNQFEMYLKNVLRSMNKLED